MILKNKIKNKQSKNPIILEYGIGRAIWLKTEHAVVLHKQIRTTDTKYSDFLQRLRKCECTNEDHQMLLSIVVGSKHCDVKSLDETEWRDATILVFSNAKK